MVKFVDVPLDVGNAERAVSELNAALADSSNARRQEVQTQEARPATTTTEVDPRFAGKSTDEIVRMYKNLESHSGRLASQVGETRRQIDQLILGKRTDDLRQAGAEPVKIQATDLMTNPTEAIDRLIQSRESPKISALQERINQIEMQLGQTTFALKHPNAQEDTIDPAFQAWVQETPLRQKLMADAAGGNPYASDALLTEWNHAKPQAAVNTNAMRAQELARKVALESSNVGSESGNSPSTRSARTVSRRDLIKLRQTDPDKYDAMGAEIFRAYAEKRVVD
jgi:hypothetical protein